MTYISDAYVYDSQEIPRPPVVPGPFDDAPTMMMVGEITCSDGHTVLVPQPVEWTRIETRIAQHMGLSFTGVMDAIEKGPQTHAERRSARPPMPVWPVVLIVAGLALVAFGLLMNGPVSMLIYMMIHGR